MTKLEILQMYIDDLNSQVAQSPARDNRIAMLIDERNKAINYSQCCTQLKDKKVIDFDLWCKIKNIHHSFDDFYLWDTTLIEKEYVLKMYQNFTQNL